MDQAIRSALARNGVIDITTTGRKTGLPRRIEIYYHVVGGRIFISGTPRADRKRGWLWNLETDPKFMFHLKRGVTADLPATARVITDVAERRAVLKDVARNWDRPDLEVMVAHSPLVEVTIEGSNETP